MDHARNEERVEVDAEIRFRYPEVFTGRMKDFCAGGMGAQIPVTMDVDSPVEMEIFNGNILASGHVRWLRIEGDHVTVGIQFREGEQDLIKEIGEMKGNLP